MARLRPRRPLLTSPAPGGLRAFVQALTNRNPMVSVIQVELGAQDTEASQGVARATANRVPNATVRLHLGKALGGEILFSTNKPSTHKLCHNLYTLPHPHNPPTATSNPTFPQHSPTIPSPPIPPIAGNPTY